MSSNYSSLKFELITTGEESGSWGTTTNTNLGTAVEQAIAGMATLTSADFTANVCTLTLTNTNALQNARAMCIVINAGAVTAAGTLNVPAIQKSYLIINNASFAVTVKVTGLTGITVPAGKRTIVYNNGTDVGNQIDSLGSGLAVGGAVTASNGTIVNALSYDTNGLIGTTSNHSLGFMTNSVVNMRLDSSGNLGLGVTPSAWSGYGKTLEMGASGNYVGANNTGSYVGAAIYYAGGWKYARNSYALQYVAEGATGQHQWFTAPSGTAGGTITFTQAMTLDANGNLGIGTSSPSTKLVVSKSTGGNVSVFTNTTDADLAINLTSGVALLSPTTGTLAFGTSSTERMRINSSGNLGLGFTPSAWSSSFVALQITSSLSLWGNASNAAHLSQNVYYNAGGSYVYTASNNASQYSQINGSHIWYNAPAGTAGNPITFTQAMTLDASNVLTLNAGALREHQTALAAANFDLTLGNFFSKTLSGNTTFTVSNVPSAGTAASFILDLTNGGSATITWWSGVKWAYGVAPSLTVSGRDVLGFFTYDGGTTWNGLVLGKDMR